MPSSLNLKWRVGSSKGELMIGFSMTTLLILERPPRCRYGPYGTKRPARHGGGFGPARDGPHRWRAEAVDAELHRRRGFSLGILVLLKQRVEGFKPERLKGSILFEPESLESLKRLGRHVDEHAAPQEHADHFDEKGNRREEKAYQERLETP